MIKLPQQSNIWTQPNLGDSVGDIYASYNIDTQSNRGRIRVSDRMMLNTSDTTGYGQSTAVANMGMPVAFRAISTTIYAIAGSKLLQAFTYPGAAFATFTANSGSLPSNLTSDYSDMEYFNGFLYMTGSDKIITKMDIAHNFTTITDAGFGSNETKMLCVFATRMYMTYAGCKIASWDTADTIAIAGSANALDLKDSATNKITFIRASSNRIWIGTVNTLGGKGYVYEWDGSAQTYTKAYRLESQGALSCVIKDDIPYIMDTYGNLLVWNGGTFKKLTSFYRVTDALFLAISSPINTNYIHPNGMSLINGKIHLLVKTQVFTSSAITDETLPGGIYVYDESTISFVQTNSLIHRYSFSYLDQSSVRTDNEDFGQVRISQAGALSEMNLFYNNSIRNGTFLAGAVVFTDASSFINGIWNDDSTRTKQKAGYIITSKFDALDSINLPSVQNSWQNIYTMYRRFIGSTDKITVKYRILEIEPVEITLTWVNNTSFTTTTDVSALTGYEVEVLQGSGGGRISHILSVTGSGTYTVTVDETYPAVSTRTAIARIQNWKKISTIISSSATYDQAGVGGISNWIQLKIWMLFTGKDEIEKLILINQNFNPAN